MVHPEDWFLEQESGTVMGENGNHRPTDRHHLLAEPSVREATNPVIVGGKHRIAQIAHRIDHRIIFRNTSAARRFVARCIVSFERRGGRSICPPGIVAGGNRSGIQIRIGNRGSIRRGSIQTAVPTAARASGTSDSTGVAATRGTATRVAATTRREVGHLAATRAATARTTSS